MVLSTTKMTAEQFLELGEDPPGIRLELVEGEIALAFRLKGKKYISSGRGEKSQIVRLPPFPELEIPLSRLWRE